MTLCILFSFQLQKRRKIMKGLFRVGPALEIYNLTPRLRKLCSNHFPTQFNGISCRRVALLDLSGLAVCHPTLHNLALLFSGVSLILSSRTLQRNTGLENSQFHNANTCLWLNVFTKENASLSTSEIVALDFFGCICKRRQYEKVLRLILLSVLKHELCVHTL